VVKRAVGLSILLACTGCEAIATFDRDRIGTMTAPPTVLPPALDAGRARGDAAALDADEVEDADEGEDALDGVVADAGGQDAGSDGDAGDVDAGEAPRDGGLDAGLGETMEGGMDGGADSGDTDGALDASDADAALSEDGALAGDAALDAAGDADLDAAGDAAPDANLGAADARGDDGSS
jgi:hypothetical protein